MKWFSDEQPTKEAAQKLHPPGLLAPALVVRTRLSTQNGVIQLCLYATLY